jgi:hypothetical protein
LPQQADIGRFVGYMFNWVRIPELWKSFLAAAASVT